MVVFDEDFTEKKYMDYQNTLNKISGYENNFNIHQESVTFNKDNMNKQMVTLYVPQDKDKINDFILLNDRTSGEEYEISDEGVIINEKLAKLLGVSIGDTISMHDEDNNSYDVKIDKIAENYIMHQMYMSPSYYENIFNKKAIYNTEFLNFDKNKEVDDGITSKLMECDNVINVTSTSQVQKSAKEVTDNMNLVIFIIILVAGCLAFTVLFNLNNINVSERIRELSTIKVLGFFDNEVTMYILRENIILTTLGILTGSFLGKILHVFVLSALETDTLMIYPGIYINSYIFSALITILFTVIVMVIMHIKLKNVNMIDALKSNE
jgi:putative ABC transport system permease protein